MTRGADGKLTIMLDGIGVAAKLDLQKDLPELSAEMKQKIAAAMTKVLVQGEKLAGYSVKPTQPAYAGGSTSRGEPPASAGWVK